MRQLASTTVTVLVPGASSAAGVDYVIRVFRLFLHVLDYFRLRLVLRYARVPRQTASDVVHFLIDGMTSIWSTCVPVLAPFSVGYIELTFKNFPR